MKLRIFSIYDIKSGSYLQPMFFRREEEAVRAFAAAVQNIESDFFKYAEDYVLYELGIYDDQSGVISSTDPRSIISAVHASNAHKEYYGSLRLKDFKDVEQTSSVVS